MVLSGTVQGLSAMVARMDSDEQKTTRKRAVPSTTGMGGGDCWGEV